MATFEIIVGSVLGASEYVADALEGVLVAHQHKARIHLHPDINDLDQTAIWLVCTSTHGAGDLPDNIQRFARQCQQRALDSVKFSVVGLGDSSYDTFCNGAVQIENILKKAGAVFIQPAVHIDVLVHPIPEDLAVKWLEEWLSDPQLN